MKKLGTEFRRVLRGLEIFFSSWRFPVFMLSVLLLFLGLIITISLIPIDNSAAGTFAREFKRWCLGYDPATGSIESIYLIVFIVQPLILSTFIWLFWHAPLKKLFKENWKAAIPYMATAFLLVALIGSTLPALNSSGDSGELPFPAQDLRTEIPSPEFTLVDQRREKVSLGEHRGKVVLITAVYASCGETCPLILEEVKELFQSLDDKTRDNIQLLAVTLDPEKDTPKMLKMTAEHYGLTADNQHLLTGEPGYVNEVLDRLNIPRKRADDGSINHANVFVLVDRRGKVAYRFTLGDRQQKWLMKATNVLLNEQPSFANINELP